MYSGGDGENRTLFQLVFDINFYSLVSILALVNILVWWNQHDINIANVASSILLASIEIDTFLTVNNKQNVPKDYYLLNYAIE